MSIERTFAERTAASAAHADRAGAVLPGGDTRTAAHHLPYQLTMRSADGPWITDLDGNRYVDLIGNFTSLVHGNAHPTILDAAGRAMAAGTNWPARNEHAVLLAEELVRRLPSVDRVRFTNSGSEATLLAAEIARVVTGRRRIVMARWGYHGCAPYFECGTMGHAGPETTLATFGDIGSFATSLADHAGEVACVIVEPVLGSSGVVDAPPGFLAELATVTHDAGALLILDEVITLRLAPGGAQAMHAVTPDLTAMAKVIGGGFPVGAVGGRAELMDVTDPYDLRLFHSGTFNGNPVTTAAGLASMELLTSDAIAVMDGQAERLEERLHTDAATAGVPFSSRRVGSLLQLYLQDEVPATNADRLDGDAIGLLHLAALNEGLFAAARGMIALSTVMTDDLLAGVADRYAAAFEAVATEL